MLRIKTKVYEMVYAKNQCLKKSKMLNTSQKVASPQISFSQKKCKNHNGCCNFCNIYQATINWYKCLITNNLN